MMARRWIGQERLNVGAERSPRCVSLNEISVLVDWAEIDRDLAAIYAAAKGEPGWPPLALFKALLLAMWHDLSDMKLAEALDDRASFRRFCGFSASEATPERTAFVRFRTELVRRGLDRALCDAITRQLDAKGVAVRTGTLVDATLIASASIQRDDEARWAGHRRRKPVHGYKAHIATDQGAVLIRGVEITTANVHDAASWKRCCRCSRATFTATAPMPAVGWSGSSLPAAAEPAQCKPVSGAARKRSPACRLTMPRCMQCAPASRKCSAPALVHGSG